jgi:hypothetical protein
MFGSVFEYFISFTDPEDIEEDSEGKFLHTYVCNKSSLIFLFLNFASSSLSGTL